MQRCFTQYLGSQRAAVIIKSSEIMGSTTVVGTCKENRKNIKYQRISNIQNYSPVVKNSTCNSTCRTIGIDWNKVF